MNNARETFNIHLNSLIADNLPDFNVALFEATGVRLYTGDEANPEVIPPSVEIHWLDEYEGLKPESRGLMVQITLRVPERETRRGDQACDTLLGALGLKYGSCPVQTIPKKNFLAGLPGVDVGTNLIIYKYRNRGWTRPGGHEQQERVYALTLLVDYVPG